MIVSVPLLYFRWVITDFVLRKLAKSLFFMFIDVLIAGVIHGFARDLIYFLDNCLIGICLSITSLILVWNASKVSSTFLDFGRICCQSID